MTREEAIGNLNMIRVAFIDTVTVEQGKIIDDTFRAAIQALKQEPKDTWSIKDVANTFKKHGLIREQEPCEEEYIKVPKKALKYRTAGMVAYNVEWLKNHFDIERAVICGAQESCKDAISKEAVDILVDELARAISDERCYIPRGRSTATIMQDILDLPPVNPLAKDYNTIYYTPQPKTGRWIFDKTLDEHYYCSECKSMGVDYWDYCPNCGAKMIEPQESEDKE